MARAALVVFVSVVLWCAGVAGAAACPDCATALEARERFAGEELIERVMIALAPFVVILGAVAATERTLDRRRRPSW